jgi:ribulose-phosphate 3-epimerase
MSRPTLADFDNKAVAIAPSIFAADFANLGRDIQAADEAGADMFHIDVMDAHFAPNLSISPIMIEAIRPLTKKIFDVHLMMTNPLNHLEAFARAGADHITFHVECHDPIGDVIAAIRKLGMTAGLAVNPKTPGEALLPWLDELDMLLVMTVQPGFSGQRFIAGMLPKMEMLRHAITRSGRAIHLEVDGGVNATTGQSCAAAGANLLVAASAVYNAGCPLADAVAALRHPVGNLGG